MSTGSPDAAPASTPRHGLSLAPFRALRPDVDSDRLGRLLCPPYDVIDPAMRQRLLDGDADNAVAVVLPEPTAEGYADAAEHLRTWIRSGLFAVDDAAALYVYEMSDGAGSVTRGLMGAIELSDPDDGVILPHENTMAGPVADRLAVMTATEADLEPIYLVYDGGGAASDVVRDVDPKQPLAEARTPDGVTHRLWSISDAAVLDSVRDDLSSRRALIADGHHRYATYRERQRLRREIDGPGPWDRGLALLVDSSAYGPQVHAIHRVVTALSLTDALDRMHGTARVQDLEEDPEAALTAATDVEGFAVVLSDGARTVLVTDPDRSLAAASRHSDEPAALADLDVTVVHRGLVEATLGLDDDVDTVAYAHSVSEAIETARNTGGFALLLRPTPVAAVAAVAADGARMPRKSTLFTPKPASGLVMRSLSVLP